MDMPNRSEEMLKYVPGYYRNSKHYLAHNNAKGGEFDIIRAIIDDMMNQFNPQTATWGLKLWEEFLDLDGENKSIEERRNQIILKTLTSYITPISLERLLKGIVKTDVWVTNNVAPYTFSVEISTDNNVAVNLGNVIQVVEEVKPAHLAYEMYFSSNTAVTVSIESLVAAKWPLLAGEAVAGVLPGVTWPARINPNDILVTGSGIGAKVAHEITGTKPDINSPLIMREVVEENAVQSDIAKVLAPLSGEEITGNRPEPGFVLSKTEIPMNGSVTAVTVKAVHRAAGTEEAGTIPAAEYVAYNQDAKIAEEIKGGGVLVKYYLTGEDAQNGTVGKSGIDTETSAESVRVVFPMCGEEL